MLQAADIPLSGGDYVDFAIRGLSNFSMTVLRIFYEIATAISTFAKQALVAAELKL